MRVCTVFLSKRDFQAFGGSNYTIVIAPKFFILRLICDGISREQKSLRQSKPYMGTHQTAVDGARHALRNGSFTCHKTTERTGAPITGKIFSDSKFVPGNIGQWSAVWCLGMFPRFRLYLLISREKPHLG